MLLIGSAGALLLLVTAALWAWYGTTVFFEILRAGWMACF
jgi:low temperature requirement protein LtrA